MEAVVFCLLILNEKLFVDLYFKVQFFKNVVLTFYKQSLLTDKNSLN